MKMLKKLSNQQIEWVKKTIGEMSLEEKVGQLLCLYMSDRPTEDWKTFLNKVPLGGIYPESKDPKKLQEMYSAFIGATKIPVIVCGDFENGLGCVLGRGCTDFPTQMACGAADSEELAEVRGKVIAAEGRAHGFHWTFSPVVDISINPNNPATNIRSFSENPKVVARLSKAVMRGLQEGGRMAATCKHFPGDGVDDREQHMCTSVNFLNREVWEKTYGHVWREVINEGTMSIMVGHIALPFVDNEEKTYLGPIPATLSKKIQIDFLRKELGFEGLIISDAISMIGYACHLPIEERAVANISAGSDMVLFAEPEDFERLLDAAHKGKLSEERVNDAVRHVLELKIRVDLIEGKEIPMPSGKDKIRFRQCSEEIARRSIKIIRNEKNILPISLKKGARILTVTMKFDTIKYHKSGDLKTIDSELRKRGYEVEHMVNPHHTELFKRSHEFDAILININIGPQTFMGSNRMAGRFHDTFWKAFWHNHPCVVFTSFGDPYKIYELPYVPVMVNTFGSSTPSQKSAVKVWLGEENAIAKNPINLKGFFNMEVD
jgi:beta-N-acetylhexosaminidase